MDHSGRGTRQSRHEAFLQALMAAKRGNPFDDEGESSARKSAKEDMPKMDTSEGTVAKPDGSSGGASGSANDTLDPNPLDDHIISDVFMPLRVVYRSMKETLKNGELKWCPLFMFPSFLFSDSNRNKFNVLLRLASFYIFKNNPKLKMEKIQFLQEGITVNSTPQVTVAQSQTSYLWCFYPTKKIRSRVFNLMYIDEKDDTGSVISYNALTWNPAGAYELTGAATDSYDIFQSIKPEPSGEKDKELYVTNIGIVPQRLNLRGTNNDAIQVVKLGDAVDAPRGYYKNIQGSGQYESGTPKGVLDFDNEITPGASVELAYQRIKYKDDVEPIMKGDTKEWEVDIGDVKGKKIMHFLGTYKDVNNVNQALQQLPWNAYNRNQFPVEQDIELVMANTGNPDLHLKTRTLTAGTSNPSVMMWPRKNLPYYSRKYADRTEIGYGENIKGANLSSLGPFLTMAPMEYGTTKVKQTCSFMAEMSADMLFHLDTDLWNQFRAADTYNSPDQVNLNYDDLVVMPRYAMAAANKVQDFLC